LTSGLIQAVRKKKQLDRTWLCAGIPPLLYDFGNGRSVKRRGKSCSLHSKKKFLLGGCSLSVSDVISGGLFGQLHLALGANR